MPPRSALVELSYTVDSASDDDIGRDDLNAMPTPDSNAENKAPARKARGKAAQTVKAAPAKKVAGKAKTTARRASGGSVLGVQKQNAAVAKKPAAKRGRKALAERETGNRSGTEEVDEFSAEDEVVKPVDPPKARRGRPAKAKVVDEEADSIMEMHPPGKKTRKQAEPEPAPKKMAKARATTKARASKRTPEPEPEQTILETQPDPDEPDPMDVEESIEFDEIPESQPPPPARPAARRARAPPRASSKQSSVPHRRAGSASDTERDPALRRKLGEATKKLESMTMKYNNLKEVASSEKDSNFALLQKLTRLNSKDQEKLIGMLKDRVAELEAQNPERDAMRKQVAALTRENGRLEAEYKAMSATAALQRNENKALANKLAAARAASAAPETKVPGSAVKARSVVLPGTAEAAKEAQLRQSKLDLYSDLTGLVICGWKKGEENEDIYDCLQTGRNGTLHFHLTVYADGDVSYDDAEFIYEPQLQKSRDQELLDLLPEYLTEEICFPRSQAAKFFLKVVDSMSKKIILEE